LKKILALSLLYYTSQFLKNLKNVSLQNNQEHILFASLTKTVKVSFVQLFVFTFI